MRVGRRIALERLARMPRTHRLLRSVAKRRAGAHFVAAVAVLLDGDDVLIAEHPFRFGAWALPGGWINRLEDPFRAVERELAEELGVVAHAVAVIGCERQGDERPVRPSSLTLAFRCRLAAAGRPALRLESGELRSARWVGIEEISQYLSPFEQRAVVAAQDRRAAT